MIAGHFRFWQILLQKSFFLADERKLLGPLSADYYNSVRTHRSLQNDAPISRPIQQIGIIRSHPILGGLHHHYVRI
jgi:hypothetical protein